MDVFPIRQGQFVLRFRIVCLLLCSPQLAPDQQAFAQSPLEQANPLVAGQGLPTSSTLPSARAPQVEVSAPSMDQAIASEEGHFAGAIRIVGARQIPVSAFSGAIEPFVGQRLRKDDLARLSRAVADAARKRGYVFATAWVPKQVLSMGILTVRLDEGDVSRIQINGPDNRQVRKILAVLKGHAPLGEELERQLLLVANVPGVVLNKVRFERQGGKGVLVADVTQDRVKAYASVDNLGSDTVGPVRAILSVDLNSLLLGGDVLTVQGVATAAQPGELSYGAVRYAMPLGARGTTLALHGSGGVTKPGGALKGSGVSGRSAEAGIEISQAIVRNRKLNVSVFADFSILAVQQNLSGLRFRDDRVTTLALGLLADTALLGGRLRETVTVVRGLGLFGATGFGDPLASRDDASGRFTFMNAYIEWTGTVIGPVSLKVAGTGQIASGPLLSVNEMGLGGSRFGRAYGYSERTGDEGVAGNVEARTDFKKPIPWVDWLQLYAFADGGVVRNFNNGFGGGELYSGGAGFRARVGKVNLGVESAFPINADRFDSGNRSARFNFQVSAGF